MTEKEWIKKVEKNLSMGRYHCFGIECESCPYDGLDHHSILDNKFDECSKKHYEEYLVKVKKDMIKEILSE